MHFFQRAGIAGRLSTAFALILSVTLVLAVFSASRVDSIASALQSADSIRNSELDPLYTAREALARTGIAARNAYIFKDESAARGQLDLVDARTSARYWITGLSALAVLLCVLVALVLVRGLVGRLGGEPEYATAVARHRRR